MNALTPQFPPTPSGATRHLSQLVSTLEALLAQYRSVDLGQRSQHNNRVVQQMSDAVKAARAISDTLMPLPSALQTSRAATPAGVTRQTESGNRRRRDELEFTDDLSVADDADPAANVGLTDGDGEDEDGEFEDDDEVEIVELDANTSPPTHTPVIQAPTLQISGSTAKDTPTPKRSRPSLIALVSPTARLALPSPSSSIVSHESHASSPLSTTDRDFFPAETQKPVIVSCSKHPICVLQVPVQLQYTLTRKETKKMKREEKESLVSVSVRIMGTDDRQQLYFVAKDICQLICLRKGSVAKAIHDFSDSEKARMPVMCHRSTGSGCTQVLTVLTVDGVRRLMASSRQPIAKAALEWITQQVKEIQHSGRSVRRDSTSADEMSTQQPHAMMNPMLASPRSHEYHQPQQVESGSDGGQTSLTGNPTSSGGNVQLSHPFTLHTMPPTFAHYTLHVNASQPHQPPPFHFGPGSASATPLMLVSPSPARASMIPHHYLSHAQFFPQPSSQQPLVYQQHAPPSGHPPPGHSRVTNTGEAGMLQPTMAGSPTLSFDSAPSMTMNRMYSASPMVAASPAAPPTGFLAPSMLSAQGPLQPPFHYLPQHNIHQPQAQAPVPAQAHGASAGSTLSQPPSQFLPPSYAHYPPRFH